MIHVSCFTVNPFQENTYLLYNDEGEGLIIDPGFYTSEERNQIKAFVDKNNIQLSACWLTHAHLDHVFGCAFIYEAFHLIPQLHIYEKLVYDSAEHTAQSYGIPMAGLPESEYSWKDESAFTALGAEIMTLNLPGHSPGSVGFYVPSQNFVVAGDVLFRGSIGRTDLPGGDISVLERSIRDKLYRLPDDVRVYAGHGPDTTIGEEKRSNPFFKE